jgi:hypothetical protein
MTNTVDINFDSFSHGQIKSKLWLCEKLEPCLPDSPINIVILGSWYNILGFMLLVRNEKKYKTITGVDVDSSVQPIANKICDYWVLESKQVHNIVEDANLIDYQFIDVVINCSPEHMDNTNWFDNIPCGTLVCIQSSNMTDSSEPWHIKNPSHSIEDFANKYPVSSTLFLDALPIRYQDWGYERYMLIGIK